MFLLFKKKPSMSLLCSDIGFESLQFKTTVRQFLLKFRLHFLKNKVFFWSGSGIAPWKMRSVDSSRSNRCCKLMTKSRLKVLLIQVKLCAIFNFFLFFARFGCFEKYKGRLRMTSKRFF